MIITLKGANFANSNIGTLSTWTISRVLGDGATYEGVTYVDKNAAFNATVTIADGYEIGAAGVTVTMGGVGQNGVVTVNGNVITIAIASVTGNVVIKVPTKVVGVEPEAPVQYTLTIDPTPSDATVTIDGSSRKSITVNSGTSVSWSVSKSGYTTQSGSWTANADETKNITLLEDGTVVQLTSSNATFSTTDYHLTNMTSGNPLATSTQGTKGVLGWDIPANALVTLTCAPSGSYGMAITDMQDIVVESFVNSSVAVDGQNGTYVFTPVLENAKLYVSTTKFVSASYKILSSEELKEYSFNIPMVFTSEKGTYINATQTVGNTVAFAEMSSVSYQISAEIPANTITTLNVKTGGSYGMCIADLDDKVLESKPSGKADADGNIVFSKQTVPYKLWVSTSKFNKASYKFQ